MPDIQNIMANRVNDEVYITECDIVVGVYGIRD